MEYTHCNLCGQDTSQEYARIPDLLLEDPTTVAHLVQCQNCQLIYQNPRPTEEEIGQYYPDSYESFNFDVDSKKVSLPSRLAYQYGINKRCNTVLEVVRQGTLLDIGCSTGIFLNGMREKPGWEVKGVEVSDYAAQIGREQYQLDIFTGTLEEAHYPENSFDAVTMWDVFEHVHDPSGILREIHRILKPQGVLVIRVPNVDSWDAKLFGTSWAGYDAPRHLTIFGRSSLRQILTRNGFDVRKMRCNIGSYPTFVLSFRFWLYARGVSDRWRTRLSSLLYHPIMRVLSAPFFYVYGARERGPLLTVTAVKSSQPQTG